MKTTVLTGTITLGVCASGLQAGTIPGYQIIDLGQLPGAFTTQPEDINNKSEVVGYCYGPQTQLRAFYWSQTTGLIELPPPPGFDENRATAISDNGIITGVAQNGLKSLPHGWRLIGGVYHMLPDTLTGCETLFPVAVNNDGTVVGYTQSTTITCPTKAFYYSDKNGLINLTALFNIQFAYDVNNAGIATGEGFSEAFRYSPETGYESIGTLPAPHNDRAAGLAINNNNDVAGRSINALIGPDAWRAFLFTDDGGMQNISETGLARSSAEGMNDFRHVVGNDGTTSSPEQYPWLWTPASGRVLITTLVPADSGFCCVANVRDINNAGRIIARAHSQNQPDSYGYGVLLIPATVQGDATGDGQVNVDDLMAVINAWGQCPPPCPADLNHDDAVNVDDLLLVINNWT